MQPKDFTIVDYFEHFFFKLSEGVCYSNQDWQIVQHINEFLYPNLQKLHTPMRCDTSSPCVKIVEIIRFALLNTSSTTFMCPMLVHTKEFNLKEIWWFYFVFLTTSWLISSPLFTNPDLRYKNLIYLIVFLRWHFIESYC